MSKDKIPSRDQIIIKKSFEERYKKILGEKYEEFMKYSFSYLTKCIRVNTLKISVKELKQRLEKNWYLEPISWCKEGFKILPKHKVEGEKSRYDIGNIKEHTFGYFYVQESASMIPAVVLDANPGDIVLDMCAAPGSKTTQIAQYMNNKGIIIANDIQYQRLKALGINIQKMSLKNIVTTQSNGLKFKNHEFDKILIDAPCSGTGTIRKSFKVLEMYGYGLVKKLSQEQYSLLKTGFNALKKGGILVYSTCTQEPEENEAVVSRLLEEFENAKILPIKITINRSDPILEFENLKIRKELKDSLRIYPQDNDSEGFFVCKITKL